MAARTKLELTAEQCREVAAWIASSRDSLPEAVRTFLSFHEAYLQAGEGDPQRRAVEAAMRELFRALHITPSSEKRRTSGSPLAGLTGTPGKSERETLEARILRGRKLAGWHEVLGKNHIKRAERLEKRLSRMPKEKTDDGAMQGLEEIPSLEEMELTEEERAESMAAADRFIEHLLTGEQPDPALKSVSETLMPGGGVLVHEERQSLPAVLPADIGDAQVVKTLREERVRYDFSVTLTRIVLDVEKKVVVGEDGERHVIAPSTLEYGPPRYAVTWDALATLSKLTAQFAIPFNRLGTLLSTPEKRFSAGSLGRMLHCHESLPWQSGSSQQSTLTASRSDSRPAGLPTQRQTRCLAVRFHGPWRAQRMRSAYKNHRAAR